MSVRKPSALILAGLSALFLLASSCSFEEAPEQSAASPVPGASVRTETVGKGDIRYETKLQATMVATKTVNLYFQDVSGPLSSLNVSLYGTVARGQVVAEIDPSEVQETIDRMELTNQMWDLRAQSQGYSATSARLNVEQAERTYAYAKNLYSVDPSAENKDYQDRCKLAWDLAKLSQESYRVNNEIFKLEHEDFKKSFEEQKERLNHCALVAPEDGYVTYVTELTIEERVTAGTHIVRFVPYKDMVLRLNSISGINLQGQKHVVITYEDEDYSAYVYTPQPGDILYQTEGSYAGQTTYLAFYTKVPEIGMNATAPLSLSIDKKGVLVIPKRCLRNVNGVTTVNLLKDGVFESRIVTCGIDSGDKIEILEGLAEGDVIAVD